MLIRSSLALTLTVGATALTLGSCSAETGRSLPDARSVQPQQAGPAQGLEDAGAPFGRLRLIEEINCGVAATSPDFMEMPAGASRIETILGRPTRVLPNVGEARYFAYRIGKGKGLKPGAEYVLSVDFPEDKSRSMFVVNRGAEMVRGFRTGQALGDVIFTHTNNNNESLKIPLSGKSNTWKVLFSLHDRFYELGMKSQNAGGAGVNRTGKPEDGFWVAIAQSKSDNDPISAGAAASRIRLYEVADRSRLNTELALPQTGLPQRHLFWREEMADGVIGSEKPEERGVTNRADWYEYKARLMNFLGMNTFTKDLLEFGHNQGWDSGRGNDWYNASRYPDLWGNVVDVMGRHKLNVLPYYEYSGGVGAKGIGTEKRAMPLSGAKNYTHISWTEKSNLDITDPESLTDAKRLLDATIVRHKDKARFVGAWFRPRPSQMPIGFADATLARFAREANQGKAVTREQLKGDTTLLSRYYGWWFGKRREFLVGLRDHLRNNGIAGADILMTADASEPGRSLRGPHTIVTDDVAVWKQILEQPAFKGKLTASSYEDVVRGNRHLESITSPRGTWGEWEWQHSDPQADPQNYRDTEGVLLTYSTPARGYSTASPTSFNAFRTRSGLAAVMHYPLNEHSMEPSLGYVASDVEYAGPFSMLSEARAMAYGDPRYFGYLAASSFNRGFPEYARAFNAAFLSLPALPSEVLTGASPDPEVVVRQIKTAKNGTYYAIVNVGLTPKSITVTLPTKSRVVDATNGKAVAGAGGSVKLSLYPCQLRSLRVP
jgi:hypothetical protein